MDTDPLPLHNFHHYRCKVGIWDILVEEHKSWIVLHNFPLDIGRGHMMDREEDRDIRQPKTCNDHQDKESEQKMDKLVSEDRE